MKKIDISCGAYASHWGLTDFYKESENLLREAISSGEDFEATYGCKKEIHYATIKREGGKYTITVCAHMDDLFESDDLILDALWARLHVDDGLTDEMVEHIREFAIDDGIDDYTVMTKVLDDGATFEDICGAISTLEDEVEEANTNMFNRLCDIVEGEYKGWEDLQ